MGYISFYREGHRFRDEFLEFYRGMRRLVKLAYGDDFTFMFDWDQSGSPAGHLSIMIIVYVCTLFEELMRDAYIFINPGRNITDNELRKNTQSWYGIKNWLVSNNLLNSGLLDYEQLISELHARRNCLVHKNSVVDEQYIKQATEFGGIAAFKLGDRIWTNWKYHEKLVKELVSFQMFLGIALENHINNIHSD